MREPHVTLPECLKVVGVLRRARSDGRPGRACAAPFCAAAARRRRRGGGGGRRGRVRVRQAAHRRAQDARLRRATQYRAVFADDEEDEDELTSDSSARESGAEETNDAFASGRGCCAAGARTGRARVLRRLELAVPEIDEGARLAAAHEHARYSRRQPARARHGVPAAAHAHLRRRPRRCCNASTARFWRADLRGRRRDAPLDRPRPRPRARRRDGSRPGPSDGAETRAEKEKATTGVLKKKGLWVGAPAGDGPVASANGLVRGAQPRPRLRHCARGSPACAPAGRLRTREASDARRRTCSGARARVLRGGRDRRGCEARRGDGSLKMDVHGARSVRVPLPLWRTSRRRARWGPSRVCSRGGRADVDSARRPRPLEAAMLTF